MCERQHPLFFILFIFRERGKEGEKEGEKHQCVVIEVKNNLTITRGEWGEDSGEKGFQELL